MVTEEWIVDVCLVQGLNGSRSKKVAQIIMDKINEDDHPEAKAAKTITKEWIVYAIILQSIVSGETSARVIGASQMDVVAGNIMDKINYSQGPENETYLNKQRLHELQEKITKLETHVEFLLKQS